MEVLRIAIEGKGVFYTDDTNETKASKLTMSHNIHWRDIKFSIVNMTKEEYYSLPATNESYEFFNQG